MTQKNIRIGIKWDEGSARTLTDKVNKVKKDLTGASPKGKADKKRRSNETKKEQKATEIADKKHIKRLNEALKLEKKITAEQAKQARERKKQNMTSKKGGSAGGMFSAIRGGSMTSGASAGFAAGGLAGGAIGGIASLGMGIGSRIVSFMRSQITSGYASYVSAGRARAGISGMGHVSESTLLSGQRQGYSVTDTLQQMQGMGRATGQLSPTIKAQQIARSYGGDVSGVTDFFGTLTKAGQGFGGKAGKGGNREMRRILSDAFKSGLDKSRAGEVLQAVATGIRSAQGATAGKVDASGISGLLSFFSRSGKSGLQGARGAQVMGSLDSTIKGAGRLSASSDVVKTLLFQSQGFGVPGGNTDYLTAAANLDQGVFGKGGAGNLMKMVKRVQQMGGNHQMQAAQLSALTQGKLNQSVSGSVIDVVNKKGGPEEALKAIAAITKEQKPINEQLLDNSGESLKVARRVAKLENRLYLIGQASAEDIEDIQDSMLEVADALMPATLVVLRVIATGVRTVVDLLRPLLDALPGGHNDAQREAGVAASGRATNYTNTYGSRNGTRGLKERDRRTYSAANKQAESDMGSVLEAQEAGNFNLSPEMVQRYQREQQIAHSAGNLLREGAPISRIGDMSRSSVLRRRLRADRGSRGTIDFNSERVSQYESSTLRDQYAESHNNESMPQEELTRALMVLRGQLAAMSSTSAREAALLDLTTYRTLTSPVEDTASDPPNSVGQ